MTYVYSESDLNSNLKELSPDAQYVFTRFKFENSL